MKTRFHFLVAGKEVIKKDSVVMVKGEMVQLPSITLPDLEIDVETEYQPKEVLENWETVRQIIKELPEAIKELKDVFDCYDTLDTESTVEIIKEVMKKVDTDNE